jgi:C_GCAxxG_C_C family probable redox protein
MTKVDDVSVLFKKGYNCAQSLLAVYGSELELDYETALRIASGFGGGIVDKGDTCGAVTGAIMIIGLKYASVDINNEKAEAKTHDAAKRFINAFTARHNTVVCRDLIGYDLSMHHEHNSSSDTDILHKCPTFVQDAAEMVEEILKH